MTTLKAKLAEPNRRISGVVCTIPSATVTQVIAASGADAVIVDLEHGAVDYESAHAMIAATKGTDCAPLVRVAENSEPDVKRALDLGAEGIVFPLIRTVGDAERAVTAIRYPPRGTRGFGPFIAVSRWDTDLMSYREKIEDNLICCLLVETRDAVADIDAISAVPGIDMLIVAGFDLSTELGIPGQFDHPDFIAAATRIETAAANAGVPLGTVALAREQAEAAFARGYRIISGFDLLWLKQRTAEISGWCAD